MYDLERENSNETFVSAAASLYPRIRCTRHTNMQLHPKLTRYKTIPRFRDHTPALTSTDTHARHNNNNIAPGRAIVC